MRKRLFAPLAAVLFTATLGSAAPASDPPECVVAQRWVAAHRGALPATLPALSRYSLAYRRAIYDVLPATARESLWRQQLNGVLQGDRTLTDAQRATVREMLAQLPALTAHQTDRAAADRLRARLTAEFGRDGYRRVFGVLGPVPERQNTTAARQPLCNCEDDGDCEGGTCGFTRCSFTEGCGPFWSYTCTGFCKFT